MEGNELVGMSQTIPYALQAQHLTLDIFKNKHTFFRDDFVL